MWSALFEARLELGKQLGDQPVENDVNATDQVVQGGHAHPCAISEPRSGQALHAAFGDQLGCRPQYALTATRFPLLA